MYGKIVSNEFLSMLPPYDVNLMYIKVVELDDIYLVAEDDFKIY